MALAPIHPGIAPDWRVSIRLRILRTTARAHLVAAPFDGPANKPGVKTAWVARSVAIVDAFHGETCHVSVPAWLARKLNDQLG
jgi:hypothetical protein